MKKNIKLQSVILIIGTLLFLYLPAIGQIDENYWENQKNAFAASSAEEYQSSLKFCNEVLKVVPHHPVINYLAARLNEKLGNGDSAFKYLKKAAQLGYTSKNRWLEIHPMNDPVFSALRKKKEFQEIIEIMNISDKPVHKSQIAFTVKDKELDPEGITYDPVEKMFYLGCTNKIVRVDHSGKCSVFTREGQQDGCWYNGIHVDPINRTLWACSNDEKGDNVNIFKYDLSSGRLIKKYPAPSDGSRHFFNDLVIHPNGDVYITNTMGGAIFMIPHASDTLQLFLKNKVFSGPNGITVSEDGRMIYTTTNFGICKINIKTKSVTLLTHEKNFHTYGIDGLYFADNYLYAIQNELLTQVSRFSLNEDATHLESCEIFERNTDDLRAPTTGVIVDDYFYFIADTQGKRSKLEGVVVMKAPLKKPDLQ